MNDRCMLELAEYLESGPEALRRVSLEMAEGKPPSPPSRAD